MSISRTMLLVATVSAPTLMLLARPAVADCSFEETAVAAAQSAVDGFNDSNDPSPSKLAAAIEAHEAAVTALANAKVETQNAKQAADECRSLYGNTGVYGGDGKGTLTTGCQAEFARFSQAQAAEAQANTNELATRYMKEFAEQVRDVSAQRIAILQATLAFEQAGLNDCKTRQAANPLPPPDQPDPTQPSPTRHPTPTPTSVGLAPSPDPCAPLEAHYDIAPTDAPLPLLVLPPTDVAGVLPIVALPAVQVPTPWAAPMPVYPVYPAPPPPQVVTVAPPVTLDPPVAAPIHPSTPITTLTHPGTATGHPGTAIATTGHPGTAVVTTGHPSTAIATTGHPGTHTSNKHNGHDKNSGAGNRHLNFGGNQSSGRHGSGGRFASMRGGGHGGFHIGGGGHGGFHHSDIRLKEDIAAVGRLDNGIGLYRFRYRGGDGTVFVGVMAQEVQTIVPDAVARGRDSYLWVDYDRIGIPFLTWKEWTARRGSPSY
jgi:hypothetical protein